MNSNKLVALRDAINALLSEESPAAPATAPVAAAPAPAPVAESIWTADKIVRWVDRGAGARNSRGARIVDGATDPLGLLAVAAANPGRPVYSAEYPKTGRQPDGLLVSGNAVSGTAPKPRLRGTLAPAPVALAPATDALMAEWLLAYPEAAATLQRILAAGIATREYTYRDMLALAGIVPARQSK